MVGVHWFSVTKYMNFYEIAIFVNRVHSKTHADDEKHDDHFTVVLNKPGL